MAELKNEEKKELEDRLKDLSQQIKKQPDNLVLRAGFVFVAGQLKQHDKVLDQCAKLFYENPKNFAFLKIYTCMISQCIEDGRYDLIEEHRQKFNKLDDMFENIFEAFENLCNQQTEEASATACRGQLLEFEDTYLELKSLLNLPAQSPANTAHIGLHFPAP